MGQLRTNGFGQEVMLSIYHTDGHVAVCAAGPQMEEWIRGIFALIEAEGMQGFTLGDLPAEDALERHLNGQGCQACAMVLSCGCSVKRMQLGQCPHASSRRLHKLSHDLGLCSNTNPNYQGPPL